MQNCLSVCLIYHYRAAVQSRVSPSRGTNASSIYPPAKTRTAGARPLLIIMGGLPRFSPPDSEPLVYDRNNNTRPLYGRIIWFGGNVARRECLSGHPIAAQWRHQIFNLLPVRNCGRCYNPVSSYSTLYSSQDGAKIIITGSYIRLFLSISEDKINIW